MKNKLFLIAAAVGALVLSGCGSKYPSVEPLEGNYVADFSKGESEEVFASDGWANGAPFNAVWKKENISYSDGQMHLSIKQEEAVADDVTYPNTSAEARTHKLYGYGDFEVRMKVAKVVGTVSTFFTYTDHWNKTDGVENKHDEIDIEFIGKDTTKVQFNYFVDGVGNHEHVYKLGFDASKEFHNYGFRWTEDSITWLVDGKTAYQVKKSAKNPLPSMPGRILTSFWPCSAEGWTGKFEGTNGVTTDYEWIKSSASTRYADGEEPVEPQPGGDFNWDEVNVTPVNWSTAREDLYTLTENEGVTNVAYEQAGEWACVVGSGVETVSNANNAMNITLKNNSASKSTVRVDVQGTTKVGNTDCLNTNATAEGHSEIYTDTNWGGSKIELAANEEVEMVINYDVTTEKGRAKMLLLFIDSLSDNLSAHAGGSISISKVKFANTSGETIDPGTDPDPDPQPEVPDPADPVWDPIQAEDLTFNPTEGYTVNKEDGVTTVTYSSASNWGNVSADVSTIANTKDTVRVAIKNNAAVSSEVRIDIQGTTAVGNTDCLNVSAEANGSALRTDETWGGSFITLAAGAKANVVITYDRAGAKGPARNLLIYMDSMQGTAKEIAGNIEIRSVKFAQLGEEPATGETDPVWDPIAATDLTWNPSDDSIYSVAKENGVTTVTYTAAKNWANVSAELGTAAVSKDTVRVTLKNNSEADTVVRVDVKGTTPVGNTDCLNVSAKVGETTVPTDTTWGGSTLTLNAGQQVNLVITFDQTTEKGAATHLLVFIDSLQGTDKENAKGSVSISDVKFAQLVEPQEDLSQELTFSDQTAYTLDPVNTPTKTLNVTYTDIGGSSYANFGAGLGNVEGKTKFSVTIKNNGSEQVKIRIDIQGTTAVGNTKDINVSATAGAISLYTDTTWGGSFLDLAGNDTATVEVIFDQTTERGAATFLMFMVDSSIGDEATRSGNITLSNFIFA